jgi:transposase
LTGQVTFLQRSKLSRFVLNNFWAKVRATYPHAVQIDEMVDNWPVHFHVDSLARLQKQTFPWPPYVPSHWPQTPAPRAIQDDLPIRLLCLPTYASWLNPIEKLWRWLKQEVLHMHPYANQWAPLKQQVAAFLEQFATGSEALLHYVGLSPN